MGWREVMVSSSPAPGGKVERVEVASSSSGGTFYIILHISFPLSLLPICVLLDRAAITMREQILLWAAQHVGQ